MSQVKKKKKRPQRYPMVKGKQQTTNKQHSTDWLEKGSSPIAVNWTK